MKGFTRNVLFSLMVNLALAGLLFGQRADRAIITGVVSDPAGRAVPQATVRIVDEATGVQTVVATTEAGNYGTPPLVLGTYTVRVEKEGFKAFVRTGIQLVGGAIYRQDAALELGTLTQTVNVTAASEMINVAAADVSHTMNEKYYEDLPVVMGADIRLAEALLYAQPGFVPVQPIGFATFRGSQFFSRINGGQTMATENWLDGAAFGFAIGHQQTHESSPPYEAIREVKMINSSFSAQYGRTSGGFIEYTSKSGTSEFHGSVYEYLANDALDARGFFAATKPTVRQNSYGFSLGGPIRKNKTFFFTNLDLMNLRQERLVGYGHTVPTPEFRQGDFSALLGGQLQNCQAFNPADPNLPLQNQPCVDARGQPILAGQIYDPGTLQFVPSTDLQGNPITVAVRDPFPGNIIPPDHLLRSSVAANWIPLVPRPDREGIWGNSIVEDNDKQLDVQTWLMRIDHTFSPNLRMTHTFWMNERPRITNCSFAGGCDVRFDPKTAPEKNDDYLGAAGFQRIANRFFHQQFDWIMRPNFFNHTTISYDRWYMGGWSLSSGVGWLSKLGITGLPPVSDTGGPPSISFAGSIPYSQLGNPSQKGFQVTNRWQFLDDLTWITGRHTIKGGFEYRRHQFADAGWGRSVAGQWSFNRLETGGYDQLGNNLSATGDPFASLILGQVHEANFPIGIDPLIYEEYVSPWVNDEIKLTDKLTVNLGLRFDYQMPRTEHLDQFSTFDPTAPNPVAGGIPGAMIFAGTGPGRSGLHSFERPKRDAWGPRFGLAYRLSDKDVIRGGYGIYYAGVQFDMWVGYPVSGFETTPTAPNLANGLYPAFYWDDGFPQDRIIYPPTIDPSVANGTSPIAVHPESLNLPRYQNWSFTYQRQLRDNLLLDISYVANRGTRLVSDFTSAGWPLGNMNHPEVLALGASLLQADINSPEAVTASITPPYPGFVGNVAQALRPFPQYQDIQWRNLNNGNSVYHSLQTKLERRFADGLQFRIAYTWSKLINDGSESGNARGTTLGRQNLQIQNPIDVHKGERALSYDDVPHMLIVTYTYQLPFGAGKRFGGNTTGVLGKLIGGWGAAALQRYQSGRPLGIFMANDLAWLLFNPVKRPNKLGGGLGVTGGDFDPATDRYLDYGGWEDPGPLQFGNAARTDPSIRTSPAYNEDISIIKDTALRGEQLRLRFEAQLGNALNRTYFCPPNTNWSSGAFGQVFGQCSIPRRIQFGLRLDW